MPLDMIFVDMKIISHQIEFACEMFANRPPDHHIELSGGPREACLGRLVTGPPSFSTFTGYDEMFRAVRGYDVRRC